MRKLFAAILAMVLGVLLLPRPQDRPVCAQSELAVCVTPTLQTEMLISNDQFVYHPNLYGWDIQRFLETQSGVLKNYHFDTPDGTTTPAEEIEFYSFYYSINPQVLLTLLEFHNQLLSNPSAPEQVILRAMRYDDKSTLGLSKQIERASVSLYHAFYRFYQSDQGQERFLNAASFAVMATLTGKDRLDEWSYLDWQKGYQFREIFRSEFGDPLRTYEPTLSVSETRDWHFPWTRGEYWIYQQGPHSGGFHDFIPDPPKNTSPVAALDFAPRDRDHIEAPDPYNCGEDYGAMYDRWIVAAAPGEVWYSNMSLVVVKHGGGWFTQYYHVAKTDRVPEGELPADRRIGHPSNACKHGGYSDLSHVHFVMGHNGVQVPATGQRLSGWTVEGNTLTKPGVSPISVEGMVRSENDATVPGIPPATSYYVKTIYISIPWWYTFYTTDGGNIRVLLDNQELFTVSGAAGCPSGARTKWVGRGYHDLKVEYSTQQVEPSLDKVPWPVRLTCGAEPPTPPPDEQQPPPDSSPTPPANVDYSTFVADITIPDGTVLSPGQSFTKVWQLHNTGLTMWGSGYELAFTGGSQMGAPNSVSVPSTSPGDTASIAVTMQAPTTPGTYQGNWQMKNPDGFLFGEPVWVVIVVPSPAPPTDDVELISCSFSPTTLTSGGTLKVDFKVTNHGDNTVSTQGPDPGYVYQEGQSSDTIGHPDVPGRWRVAVEYGDRPEAIKDHPYRWGLGSDLAPGETRTVSGYITLNTIKRTDYWCALIHEQVGGGEDYVGGTTITVQEPDRIGPRIVSHHFEPGSPSNTGVVQVCAEAQDNPGGVGVDHIGVCIDGCQYNESIWGAGGCVPWQSGHPTYTPGVHDVQIMAVDKNGNWGPSVWTCYTIGDRDITAPRVRNISFSPPSGSPESGTTSNVHIRVEWEDPCGESGIQSTTVFATDCTFGKPPLGSRTWSPAEFDWYVGCLPLGKYEIDVYMQDYKGNARSEFFPYQRGVNDETPPTGSILVNPTPRDSWTVEYTADALPYLSTPAWRRAEGGGYESVSNGILRSGTPDPGHFNYYRQEANLSNQTGTTLEARLKVVSGQPLSTGAIGNNISIFDDARKIRLAIFPDGIRLGDCDVCDEYQMNTTDDFHVYRLTLEGDTAKAYVDGVLRLTGTPVANSAWTEIWFGNDWMGGPDEGLWDYVRYYTGGAVPPPWSVEYTGDALPLASTPPWERLNQGGYESVSNGILRSGTPDNDHFNYYRQITDVSNETGATLEARLKVVSGQPLNTHAIGNHITILDDARKIRLTIFPDGIGLGDCEVCDEYPMDTIDDFHVYRLTLQGDVARAYVDGFLRLTGTPVANSAWMGMWFGNDWMGGPDEGLWDYVRYYTGGAIPPSADVTSHPEVVLALAAKDAGWGVSQMNIGTCNSDEEEYDLLGWERFVPEKTITLPPGDGLKYVKVQYSDRAGNRSDWYYDTIILDTTPPTSTVSALPAIQTATSFAVGWSGTDSPIDVAKFDVQYKDATSMQLASSSSSAWTDWYTDTTLSSALFTGGYGHTYYFRTRAIDIAGNVEEYPAGDGDTYTEICFLPADAFESDDTSGSATLIATTGVTQTHNFHVAEDEDWFKFTIAADATYIIQTGDLGPSADTYIYLYDMDATTLLNANDDYGGALASQIEWEAPAAGTYYLMVKHWNPYVGGCGTEYNVSVRLLGDLDGTCVVDVADIMLVASRWRCQSGDDCYDERFDLDKDGDTDIVDIMMVAVHWGETCG